MAENHYDLDYTGSMVDRILDTGYDLQNQGYIFRGLASHYTGTPTERTWLIAPTGSTGFGLSSPVPPGSIGICMYNGSSWSAEVLNTLTLDTAPTAGSGNGITSAAVKTLAESITNAIGQLEQSVSDRFTSLTLEDTTGSLQTELLSITMKYVFEGETESLTSISILAATAEKAGLMSAADKQKLDAFVTNIRSMRIQDTTVQADQGTEITNTLKWTIGGVTEAITAFTLYAATTSKAGLLSAADKTALDTLPSLINAGYLYAGIATPSTVPSSTSAKIFYIAIEGGTYTNFDNLNVTQGINIIYKSDNAWSAAQVVGIDNEPTAGSDNLVKSGGVKTELALGAVYDVSAHNNGATFESLSALLSDTDLNALIPTAVRKGGMSIKFVQSSDNKYVQYRLMADEFTTDTTQWAIADEDVYVENPEFLEVTTDSDDKVLEGIQTDGTKVIGGSLNVGGSAKFLGEMEVSGVLYKVIENPEYHAVWVDAEGKVIFGLRTDGKTYVGDADFLNEIKNNKNVTSEIISIIDKFFVGKRVSILGDSISTFNKEGFKIENYPMYYPTAAGDRGDDVKTVNDTWWKQVIDSRGGILEVNASYSGSTASNLVKGFSSRVPLLGNPDIIYIALGTNDSYNYVDIGDIDYDAESYDLSKFAPAYIQGLKDVFSLYPEAEVICVAFDMGEAYQNTIKTIVEHYRWSHNIQYMYVGDISDVHPNKAEMKAVADEINDTLPMIMIENPEFMDVETDIEGKILSSRDKDGVKKEYVGFETPKMSIDGHSLKNIKDIEGRTEILTDKEGKIISYRDSNGVRHEEVGIETNQLLLTKEGMEDFQQQLNESGFLPNKSVSIKEYDLPKFGYVNLVSETFYLTAAGWSSYANDVELIQDYEDSNANAWNKVTIAHFYIKGTQTKLDFYAASKVTKVDNRYYVTSTLTEIVDPVTGDVTYEVNENSVEVRQCVDVPPYKAWPVDKKTEHYCMVEIDFGHYLNGTFPVGIKYQGSSTLQLRKRNFRFTFYKNNKYEKKNKIKIGEFVRLNGFNLKANWTDNTKIKELFMNILFMAIWENRGKCTSYPWDGDDAPYNGATGMIKGFPIEVNVGGTFYGLDVFGLKKDGKNYLLDKDKDGMIEGGTRNDVGCWETAAPIDWEDELNNKEDWVIDNQTQSNYDALIDFFAFINGTLEESGTTVPFDKSTMPERMFMPAWIDYLICLQVFLMLDSTCRNVMLYTGSDKKKFYPFFYDLDASMKYDNPTMDIMIPNGSPEWQEGGCYAYDLSLWEHIKEEWWDEIVNRYHELRHSILSDEYIKAVYEEILNNIPDEEYTKESQRWGLQVSKQNFYDTINQLKVRFNWLDNEYYK